MSFCALTVSAAPERRSIKIVRLRFIFEDLNYKMLSEWDQAFELQIEHWGREVLCTASQDKRKYCTAVSIIVLRKKPTELVYL
jgi:hypothetical protein